MRLCVYVSMLVVNGLPWKAYLHSLLTQAKQPRQLRSSNSNLLLVPSVKTNVGTRAFSVAAPTLWNSLPVKNPLFKTCLSPIAPQRTNPTVYNWNSLSIMNCLTHFVLVRCHPWVSRGLYIYIYIYIYIYFF